MGKIFALRMAERGTRVAVLDQDVRGLEAVAERCENIHAYHCDVSDRENVDAVLTRVVAELGAIDRLVHCAAIMPTARLIDQDAELIERLMHVNYGGTVNLAKAVLPAMLQRGAGEVIIFGSTGGAVLVPECGAYCASKAATNAFAEVLIEETRGSGVHVMLVCPPLVDTPLLQQASETSNPKIIRESIARRQLVAPDRIVDHVERGLADGVAILLPGVATKLIMWARRISPRLLWRVILRSNRE